MPRRAGSLEGGLVCHIVNRPSARMSLFEKDEDCAAFQRGDEKGRESFSG